MSEIKYPINEIFATIQGEAYFTGMPSIFIRLQGCDVGCPWCDTKHTWSLNNSKLINFNDLTHKSTDQDSWSMADIESIIQFIRQNYATIKHIVITGGEPASYDLRTLCIKLEELGHDIQIETSGTENLLISGKTWVTLSPKLNMPGNKEVIAKNVYRANEIKMPIGKLSDIEKLEAFLSNFNIAQNVPIWLQPLSQSSSATKLCIDEAIKNNWRVSLQTHKFINIR